MKSNSDIDVWLGFYQQIDDESLLSKLRELLTDAERTQEKRFYFADDQRRYLITRAMVRTILSRYVDVAPADWMFSTNDYGRPEVAAQHEAARDLSFNISHTKGLIALAVTRGRILGVDVENIQTRQVSLGIADRFFAPTEVAALAHVPTERQQDRFFEYWTFKESYIKARGMGLSIPLDEFGFEFPHERGVSITIDPKQGDDPARWRFWQCRPAPEYLLALCAERNESAAPKVTLRKVVPNVSEERLDLEWTRVSADF
jgi:4'-phosphopantetheinyl transferase